MLFISCQDTENFIVFLIEGMKMVSLMQSGSMPPTVTVWPISLLLRLGATKRSLTLPWSSIKWRSRWKDSGRIPLFIFGDCTDAIENAIKMATMIHCVTFRGPDQF